MQFLFMDNFRGFSNTTIPLREVNFMVGENSTGKTSVLGLLHVISEPMYWYGKDFDSQRTIFGHFRDIVSIDSENRRYFHVGFADDSIVDDEVDNRFAYLATYTERQGLPHLTFLTLRRPNSEISLKFSDRHTYYKFKTYSETEHPVEWSRFFVEWARIHNRKASGYRRFNVQDKVALQSFPPVFLINMLDSTLLAENKPASRKSRAKSNRRVSRWEPVASEVVWVAPIRTFPKRTYDEVELQYSPEGSHTPYLIRKLLQSRASARGFMNEMKKFGDASGLFKSINIHRYGAGATAPFEVEIVLDEKALNINNVGYGVSQALPVVVEIIARTKGSWIAVQQPEVHLHPRAQAALGDLFFSLASLEGKHFFIETHSDFTIDRFRLSFRDKKYDNKPDSQILFFERKNKRNTVRSLPIDRNGELPIDQPKSYRNFFIREELKILGISDVLSD